jgi:D-glycero-D-manno-heptose 1,7-bisphosphate phosphatase
VFLDRDGVINQPALPGEYIRTWEEFKFLPSIADWIRLFNALDLLVIVITNQRGVALGLMSEHALEDIHSRMVAELAHLGARVDDVFYCAHAKNECNCRKPQPGLIFQAQEKWDIDLQHSLFLGDSPSDQQAAFQGGVPFVSVVDGRIGPRTFPLNPQPTG